MPMVIRMFTFFALVLALVTVAGSELATADQAGCSRRTCADVGYTPGTLTAAFMERTPGGSWLASNSASVMPEYRYQLSHPCVVDDRENGGCRSTDFRACAAGPDQVVQDLVIERQRLIQADGTAGPLDVPAGSQVGSPVGPWDRIERACVDITALNPPPSPDEVFRYFRTLPLPQLPTKQQPPGNGLVGLPVIFFTDGPTTQTFTLDIRGFTVDITATATTFTWHTGDGTDLTTTSPGAPYPDHTISHDYASGSYTASLTTTWTATFSVDGGLTVPVPGSTTTDGPPVTFQVLQARPVLTNPFD
ncbi:hypothetical protein [Blastococcus goldschmidtiae]|uniref:PKD domain-containing protein n=1 Tax=Blastococcus goldschmidtiae TaxID=3075546 RepID=A0ABU2K4E7_9ACTN|nr:hypothetical protein [Blastococcus sp. DSM 46792]MDT0275078.1 hypothetical protein [Blastococcus sp. DSM 46792]